MAWLILALLIVVPLVELAILIKVGGAIGLVPTILMLVGMAGLGTVLLRAQGRAALRSAEAALARGAMPIQSAADGAGLFLAGALMLAPGLLTDIVGLVLLVPPVRRAIMGFVFRWLSRRLRVDAIRPRPAGRGRTIEGTFERVEDPTEKPRGHSPWRR